MSYSDRESLEDATVYRQEGMLRSQARGISALEDQLYILATAIPEELLKFKDKYHKYQYYTILEDKDKATEIFISHLEDLIIEKKYVEALGKIGLQETLEEIRFWPDWRKYKTQTRIIGFELIKEYLSQKEYDKAHALSRGCEWKPETKIQLKEILKEYIHTKPEYAKEIRTIFKEQLST